MIIGWPQGILLAMMVLGIGIALSRFGEQKRDHYDFTDLVIGPAISLALLYWGGFFG